MDEKYERKEREKWGGGRGGREERERNNYSTMVSELRLKNKNGFY